MWDDNWHPDGPFSSIDAKLSSVILNMAQNWSNARSDDLVTILSKLPWIAIGECDKADGFPLNQVFSLSQVLGTKLG